MGAGIAQLACTAGARTLLHDPVPEALDAGLERSERAARRGVERGRLRRGGNAASERLQKAAALGDLAPAELVIEAAPESLEIKRELFATLSNGIVSDRVRAGDEHVVAAGHRGRRRGAEPGRVVGMHFFNPAPVMELLEVVAGTESSPAPSSSRARPARRWASTSSTPATGPGFLVNRCNRPFGLEALRLLQERVATLEEIDRICRLGGGFRMGPFELMDLVGLDIGLDVSRSFYEQSFGEPRWRPSPIRPGRSPPGGSGARPVAAITTTARERTGPRIPTRRPPAAATALIVIAGDTPLADELGATAARPPAGGSSTPRRPTPSARSRS